MAFYATRSASSSTTAISDSLGAGAADGLLAAGDRSLAEVRGSNVISGIVFDVLSDRDRILLRKAGGRVASSEQLSRKVVVLTRSGWRGFLMAVGTSVEYESRIADEFEDLLHDADEIG